VRGDDERRARAVRALGDEESPAIARFMRGSQGPGGFVGEDDRRLGDQRARDRDALRSPC
jgi:hypothetical protein